MIKFLGLLAVILCSSMAYARPGVNFQYAFNGQGEPQLKIVGQDLCDSDTFRIRVSNNLNGDKGWYTSEQGNTQWKINKNQRNNSCTLNMFLAKKYLTPGYTLEVRTYADSSNSGRRLHTFAATIPCQEATWVTIFNENTEIYETSQASPIVCAGNPADPSQSNPINQPVQSPTLPCSADAVAVDEGGQPVIKFQVSCAPTTIVDVLIMNQTNNQAEKIPQFGADSNLTTIRTVPRDPNQAASYDVEIYEHRNNGGGANLGQGHFQFYRMVTFNSPPMGKFTSQSPVTAQKQSRMKVLGIGGGFKWETTITAQVRDADLESGGFDPNNPPRIQVQLYNQTTNRIIGDSSVSSGGTVSFNLKHVQDKNGIDDKDDLAQGPNILKLKIFDGGRAYGDETGVVWPSQEMTVNVSN